ncbi:MAG: HTH-type transcriptional regulator TsaQ1/TsaQ2 [Burkholderia plantarii]|nr:MAG: HTH-type transcriptional regulator TsaQ1/TsaQ2 [Burkholderia plantarii]
MSGHLSYYSAKIEIEFRKSESFVTKNHHAATASRDRETSTDEISALARGLSVLRRIAAADAPVSNRELTELTGIPKPTVSRITATLVGAGFLFRLPDSERFVLTASVLELSNGFLRNFDIRARSRPFLIELAERTSLSVHLAVRDRFDMVAIDVIRPRSAVLVTRLEVGSRMDIARTAVGRAYLCALGADERRELLAALQEAHGDDWPLVVARLNPALDEAQRQGYAIALGEWREGLNAIAAGFVGPSGQRYAVNCGGAAQQYPQEWLLDVAVPALRECIAKITREIGGSAWPRRDD